MFEKFWKDDSGLILSAEIVTVGTLGLLGLTAGLSVVATAVNEEFAELGQAIRSLDQSYSVSGYSVTSCSACGQGCGQGCAGASAWKAGSCYRQPDIQVSLCALELAQAAPVSAHKKLIQRDGVIQQEAERDEGIGREATPSEAVR